MKNLRMGNTVQSVYQLCLQPKNNVHDLYAKARPFRIFLKLKHGGSFIASRRGIGSAPV